MSIYLIRHGQSEFNAAHAPGAPDPLIFDAPLTSKGRQQAEQARQTVSDLGIRRVITSPLTRAIQTAIFIFQDSVPISVAAGHHELLLHSCDVGRSPQELQSDFPMLSFENLADRWWYQGQQNEHGVAVEPISAFQQRVDKFTLDINNMSDGPVAIVGHGNMFKALVGFDMENCQIHRYSAD